jgi:SAM-dependent methyltransferase
MSPAATFGGDANSMTNRQEHWDSVYRTKGEQDVSWFETFPAMSLEMIEAAGLTPDTCVIDVGGGQSRLIDSLLSRGLDCLAVLDVSGEALRHARDRLGARSQVVAWIESDVTAEWSLQPMDIWHDRAVFHFLVQPDDRRHYVARLRSTLKVGGSAIVATFAPDGPERCSGLPVVRYSPDALSAELGHEFALIDARPHRHVTPWGDTQSFQYSRFQRKE